MGSLGLAPGANVGMDGSIAVEASHGAAPDIAGKGIANPVALILSGALLLRHIGKTKEAVEIEEATRNVLAHKEVLTPDLGGTSSTMDVAKAITAEMKRLQKG